MPQVPYQPIANVGPSGQDTPGLADRVPEAAFGTGVAQAVEGLGKTIESSSNQIFQEAYRLQGLKNEADARDADAQYMIQAGQIHAQFNALQGQDRVTAYPKYAQDLQDLRVKLRGTLGNDMARKMYDASSLSTMGRSIFNGAGAAAAAQKDAALGAANAQTTALTNSVYANPDDEAGFRAAVDQADATAVTKAAATPGGASPERIALIKQQTVNDITYHRIVGMARDQPNKAYQLLQQYEKEGLIVGQHDIAARAKVEGFISSVGMNVVANNILKKYSQPDGTFTKSVQDMQAEAESQATKMYPDMSGIGSVARAALDRNYGQLSWSLLQDGRARKQQIDTYITKGVTDTSMLPPELLKQMTPAEVKAFPAAANTYQRSIETQTDKAAYNDYLGLYNNDNAKFMDTNFMSVPGLSKSNREFFTGLQRKAAANGDPRVWKAMKQLEGSSGTTLDALGVTGPSKDRDTANQFVGALHDAIQSYQETNGKAPDEKTIQDQIFPTVTRQVTQKGYLWNSQTPFFQAPVPDEYKQKFLSVQPGATEEVIGRAYHRQMFDQFFKSQKTNKDQSRAP